MCALGATRTSIPAVQAAHLAMSRQVALRLASALLGARHPPLFVGVGYPRGKCSRVRSSSLLPDIAACVPPHVAHVGPPKKYSSGRTERTRHDGAEWARAQSTSKTTAMNSHSFTSLDEGGFNHHSRVGAPTRQSC